MVMCRCEKFGNRKRRSLSRELNLFPPRNFSGVKLGPVWSHSAYRGLPEAKNLPHHCFHATLPPPPSFGYLQSSLQNHPTPLPPALITPSSRLPLHPSSPSFAAKPNLSHPLIFKMGKCIRPPPVARRRPRAPACLPPRLWHLLTFPSGFPGYCEYVPQPSWAQAESKRIPRSRRVAGDGATSGDLWGAQADDLIRRIAQFVAHYYTTFDADRKALASLYVSPSQSPREENTVSNVRGSGMTPS